MKMGFGIFFGILLILVGIAIIIRIVFNIDIPVLKIFFALLFLYIGIRLLVGDFSIEHAKNGENAIFFGETYFKGIPNDNAYTVMFGYAKIDLTQEDSVYRTKKLQINTIFGGSELIIDESQPINIKAHAAFASAKLPDNNETAFGTVYYQTDSVDKAERLLDIECHVVFGNCKVKLKR